MAKDTSDTSWVKSPSRFNEQVNAILLIMFLAVVVILFLKGCDSDALKMIKYDETNPEQELVVTNDSVQNDSLTILHQTNMTHE